MKDYLWTLEYAVLTESPESLDLSCRERTPEELTEGLALACRFRGLEHVKVLVENGADLSRRTPGCPWAAVLDAGPALEMSNNINHNFKQALIAVPGGDSNMTLSVLPAAERAKVTCYICEKSERLGFDPGDLLYLSIMTDSWEITAVLKEMGVTVSEKFIAALTENGSPYVFYNFLSMLTAHDGEGFARVMRSLAAELGGKKIRFSDDILNALYDPDRSKYIFLEPEVFGFILDCFDHKKMNKMKIMKFAVDRDGAECLALCARHGWLKQPTKRDEVIAYAADNGKTECTAWLLEFKERNFDLAAERARAEKKAERELNAAPDSVTALRSIWNWRKQKDGTLIITGYKGTRTDIAVPSKIGRSEVTAIGANAFSPEASKAPDEHKARRAALTSVTLPEGIRVIGNEAFCGCKELRGVNIPDGVVEIGDSAFENCEWLTGVVIPDTVVKTGIGVFGGCIVLRSAKLSDALECVSENMFCDCFALQDIKLPSALKRIQFEAFKNCIALTKLIIPNGTVEIHWEAFVGCDALETVVVPASVTEIIGFSRSDKYSLRRLLSSVPDSITFIVERGSYAEDFFKRNNVKLGYVD